MAQKLTRHQRNDSKSRRDLYSLSKLQLIKKCKEANVPVSNSKSAMIQRLLTHKSSSSIFSNSKKKAKLKPFKPRKPKPIQSKHGKHPHSSQHPQSSSRLNPRRIQTIHSPTALRLHKSYASLPPTPTKNRKGKNKPKHRSKSKNNAKKKRKRNKIPSSIGDGDIVLVIGSHAFREFGMSVDKTLITLNNLTPLIPEDAKKDISNIYSGYYYTYYTDDNLTEIWSAGYNLHGELGCGKTGNLILPLTNVSYFNQHNINISKLCVSVNSWTVFWITDWYKVYGNGMNDDHQLGLAHDTEHQFEPVLIESLDNIIDIKSAHQYTIALSMISDRIIMRIIQCWLRWRNKLRLFPNEILDAILMFCDRKRSVWSTGFSEYGGCGYSKQQLRETKVMGWRKLSNLENQEIVKIATGYEHSLFLKQNGRLLSCGSNQWGQLGVRMDDITKDFCHIPTMISLKVKVVDIKCGMYHNLLLDEKGNVYSFGQGKLGQCGHKDGADFYPQPMRIECFNDLGHKIDAIDCGNYHSFCRAFSGLCFLFGSNKYNQCVVHRTKDRLIVPKCINNVIERRWSGKRVKNVFCGFDNTKIILCDQEDYCL